MNCVRAGCCTVSLWCWMVGGGCERPHPEQHAAALSLDSPAAAQALFDSNCRGCHSQGAEGAALPLMNKNYWAIATDAVVVQAISHGQGRLMPAYIDSEGGPFTAQEIALFVKGMRSAWGAGAVGRGGGVSPLIVAGDPALGAQVFAESCASCHGSQGTAGSVTDQMYLRLVSDQGLWSSVIYGRCELGMPAWDDALPNRPSGLTVAEVAHVVSWISSQRVAAHDGSATP